MTSNNYTDPSRDYSHMYNITDIRGPLPYPRFNTNTILGFLSSDPAVKDFFDLVSSNKSISGIFNNEQAAFTLFVPINCNNIKPENTEAYDVIKIVRYHTLENKLTPELLGSMGSSLISTKCWSKNIFVENRICNNKKYTFLNQGQAIIVGYKSLGDSNIFFIDNILSEFKSIL